jgi:hypothetical protein
MMVHLLLLLSALNTYTVSWCTLVRSVYVCESALCVLEARRLYQDDGWLAVFSLFCLAVGASEANSNVININNRDFISADHRSGKIFGVHQPRTACRHTHKNQCAENVCFAAS